MNEAQLLMYLLSRKKDESTIGATRDEICAKIGFTDRNADYKFWNLLEGLNKNLFPLGLVTKFNPINSHWYLGFQDKLDAQFGKSVHTLNPRISALLFTILILYVSKSTQITLGKVQQLRNKKDISKDVRDLEKLGFISVEGDVVTLTPKVFYYIDINDLIVKIKELKELEEK
jgi:hypothetical protein